METFVVNPGYGVGPYLRGVELGLAMNDALVARGHTRRPIIVPHLYGERQKRILLEECAKHQGEILLDKALGSLVEKTLYSGTASSFADTLKQFAEWSAPASEAIAAYLDKDLVVEDLGGRQVTLAGKVNVTELQVNPRVSCGAERVYSLCHGHVSEIFERAREMSQFAHYAGVLEAAARCARRIEEKRTLTCTAYPHSLSFDEEHRLTYPGERMIPPFVKANEAEEVSEQGVYLTLTGIPGLERLYNAAHELGVKLYSNEPARIAGSSKASPRVIGGSNILFQFARTGWSSVWLSILTGTPLVTPDFDPNDDPEIYFNNKVVEELGLGIIYRGQSLRDIMGKLPMVRGSYTALRNRLQREHGTLDGLQVAAATFANDLIHK